MTRMIFSSLPPDRYDLLRMALVAARLPIDDLAEPDLCFFELSDGGEPTGFVGLEGSGPDRLLRSLVVLPGRQRQGHGALLVAHVEAFARTAGVDCLHLLTTTAPEFFLRRGYRSADRAATPPAIAGTAQFAALCPASAAYLVKDLV